MRTQDDRAAGFDGNEQLVNRRRRRIRRGNDRGDHPERLGDLDDPSVLETSDNADGLHGADELVDPPRGEQVLLHLVGHDPVPGLVDGHCRERFGLRIGGCGHRIDNSVDIDLGQLGKLCLSRPSRSSEFAGLSYRDEVAVGRGRGLTHGPCPASQRCRWLRSGAHGRELFRVFDFRKDLLDF